MVRFNDLRIDKHTKNLIIDVSVLNYSLLKNVYLEKIYIQTQDQYSDAPVTSENSIYELDIVDNDNQHTLKSFSIELGPGSFQFDGKRIDTDKNMFFVWIKCTGVPDYRTPCVIAKEFTVGVTFDMCDIYKEFMNNIKNINVCCDIPKNFIDSFLRLEAIKISVDSGHFRQAIEFYNKFVVKKIKTESANVCGCHG